MKAKITTSAVLLILPLLFIGLIACGTDSEVASDQIGDVIGDAGSVSVADTEHTDDDAHADVVADEHDDGDQHAVDDADSHESEEAVVADHDDEADHDDVVADLDEDEAEESHAHADMDGVVDPDAPVMHVLASEFAYDTATSEVEAGRPFSIKIQNDGVLEHDITFVGLESEFGLHVQPGEDRIATFSIHEAGEYTYYCTVAGHREAGMTGTLIVSAELVSDHDEADGHDDEADEAVHDEADGHEDDATDA